MNVPKFTKQGFFKTKSPEKSWLLLQDVLKNHIQERAPEYSDTHKSDLKGWIKSDQFSVATDLLPIWKFPLVKKQVISDMFTVLKEWSGAEISPEPAGWAKRIRDASTEAELMEIFQEAAAAGVDLSGE